jgi:hypothetical protein
VLNNPTTLTDWMGNRPWDPAYDVRSNGHGSWNLQPKPGVTTVEGNTPPSFNWPNPGGPAPDPWVSNGPTDSTTQEGPRSQSVRYEDLPSCADEILATVAHVNCRVDFRQETIQRKLIELTGVIDLQRLATGDGSAS